MKAFGKKNGFLIASTDIERALDNSIDSVVIATQHNLHASKLFEPERGKYISRKTLALSHDEADKIKASQKKSKSMVMVGYNRRFSPHIQN